MAAQAVAPDGVWLTLEETGKALRLSPVTVGRMFHAGEIPGIRARSAYRISAAFVADVLAAARTGAMVDLAEFAQAWTAGEAAS